MKKRQFLLPALAAALVGAGGVGMYMLNNHNQALQKTEAGSDDVDLLIATLSDLTDNSEKEALPEDLIEPTSEEMFPKDLINDFPEEPLSENPEDLFTSDELSAQLAEALSEAEEFMDLEHDTEALSEYADASIGEAASEAGTEKYLPPMPAADHKVIFVGDSRTVGMGRAETKLHEDGCIYIGESGEGYRWFLEYGMDQLEEAIKASPALPVIFNLGVNDCDSISSYIEVYRVLKDEHPDTDFWYMSVNPVTEESPHVPNSDVLAFNEKLKAAFPDHYIDTCTWMMTDGFEDVDSIHYTEAQYCLIHDFAVEAVAQAARKE